MPSECGTGRWGERGVGPSLREAISGRGISHSVGRTQVVWQRNGEFDAGYPIGLHGYPANPDARGLLACVVAGMNSSAKLSVLNMEFGDGF
jgi:hypothetical protein